MLKYLDASILQRSNAISFFYMPDKPRFIADAMLGSLAKWLRILGFDTLYFRNIDDNALIKIAKQQQRMLLTRDAGLVKRRKIGDYILINSNETTEQLKEVLKFLTTNDQILRFDIYSRCIACNGELLSADRESVVDDVPEHVFLNFNSFLKCKDCGKVYWKGSHEKLIEKKLCEVFKKAWGSGLHICI